ncbi:MAG: metallophosphoesterase [Propionicimonas sp.]
MTAPQRILLAGDLHGSIRAAEQVIDYAAASRAGLILQLGDFGFWPRYPSGLKFLRRVEGRCAKHDLTLWFVDGNHEDFDRLLPLPVDPATGLRPVSEHVFHVPRGHRWKWAGTRWLAVGGGVSLDSQRRTLGRDWFAEEEVTDAQVETITAGGPADVVVAHDVPWGSQLLDQKFGMSLPGWRRASRVGFPADRLEASDVHQKRLRRIAEGVEAQRWYAGHLHTPYTDTIELYGGGELALNGLGTDGDRLDLLALVVGTDGYPIIDPD